MPIHQRRIVEAFAAIVCVVLLISVSSCSSIKRMDSGSFASGGQSSRQRTLLDADWLFHLGDLPADSRVTAAGFDDTQWKHVDVPHDYVLDGKYDKNLDRNHGYLPYDVGWYRKHVVIPESAKGKILRLDFDGVFRDSEVWLNGQSLGKHASGYTPFSFDITKIAKIGGDNLLVVRVDPRKFEGWWYEGGGIYRHVYLTTLSPVHVAQYGTYVTSTVPNGDQGADEQAFVKIQTTLENQGGAKTGCEVVSEVVDPDGKSVKTLRANDSVAINSRQDAVQQLVIDHPKIWSVETPYIYQLHTTVLQDGRPVDATTTNFGIRTLRFDANKGFFLNGKRVEIQGAAFHQDMAGVGIAMPDSLHHWRTWKLKRMGGNGVRTAHNPSAPAVLDACDQLGMLVMDENRHLGDAYTAKTPSGTKADDSSDLATMILRDRNHPSVIMWSMCNEEDLQGQPEGRDLVAAMAKVVHRYDQTRPITSAMNGREGKSIFLGHGIADAEDIIGANYNYEAYDEIHQRHPDKMMYGSECDNQKTTRGEYVDNRKTGMCSAYNLSESTWLDCFKRPFIAGQYVWTAWDYKGEPNPFGWPDVSNNTGLFDSCGFPKDKCFYFQSCWSDKPMVHILPDQWNGPVKAGQPVRVIVWTNATSAELFLNGKNLGLKGVPRDSHAEWKVPFEKGELVAKGVTNGKTVATEKLETTDAAARIILTADRKSLHAGSEDAVVAEVTIVDDRGRVVPTSSNRVTFELSGSGRILGVGNGNPADHDPDHAKERNAFHGRCMAVVEAGGEGGTLQVTASSPGLQSATLSLEVKIDASSRSQPGWRLQPPSKGNQHAP